MSLVAQIQMSRKWFSKFFNFAAVGYHKDLHFFKNLYVRDKTPFFPLFSLYFHWQWNIPYVRYPGVAGVRVGYYPRVPTWKINFLTVPSVMHHTYYTIIAFGTPPLREQRKQRRALNPFVVVARILRKASHGQSQYSRNIGSIFTPIQSS